MKQLLRASLLLLTAWCLALSGMQQAYASHAQGGQLTYEYIGTPAQPNRYRVTCRFFRDCSGIPAPADLTLNCRVGTPTTSCNSSDSRNFEVTMTRGTLTTGTPYCTSAGNPCSSGNQTNYETAKYEAIVTLPPAASWTLSVTEINRPTVSNVTGGSQNMHYEAVLNNQLTLPSGGTLNINNSSPQYLDQDIPIPFVCYQQRTTLTFSTYEPDNTDSLVYSLDRPLEGCNMPMTYKTFTYGTGPVFDPSSTPTNPCLIYPVATGLQNYTPTFPIPSFSVTGSCPNKQATPTFLFNATTGSFTFTPAVFDPSNLANNKYVVVGKVTEYRKINGRYYQVGSVRRDMLVVVIDCGGNSVPNPPVATGTTPNNPPPINGQDSTVVDVYTCNYSQVKVRFSDPNAGQQLTVTVGANALTPLEDIIVPNGYILSGNGTTSPVMTFLFQPSPQLVGNTVRIPVTIADNACPIKGVQNRIIVIRVKQGQFATAVAAVTSPGLPGNTIPTICPGGSIQLRGSVVRPDSVRNGLQQYSYSWAAAPGLSPTQQNSQTITVSPQQTTRYKLTIAPTIGFSTGCGDTTSIVVRVVPEPRASVRVDNPVLCAGNSATLRARATRTDNIRDAYTFTWTAANGLPTANLNDSVITVRPTATTRYRLRVDGASPYGCNDTTSVVIRVAPPILAQFTVDSTAGPNNGGRLNMPPRQFTFTNTSQVAGVPTLDGIDEAVWTVQRVRNALGERVNESEVAFSSDVQPTDPLILSVAGTYVVTLRENNIVPGVSCPDAIDKYTITVPDVTQPNVFTPNNDGYNDTFVVQTENIGNKVVIFNRWGRKIREYASYNNDWNGDNQPAGVYYYQITARNGKVSKGWVELIR